MKQKLLIFFALVNLCFINRVKSHNIECDYYDKNLESKHKISFFDRSIYICEFKGNEFSSVSPETIFGQHKSERTDDDVTGVMVKSLQSATNVLKVLCKKFMNLEFVFVFDVDTIDEDALHECTNLKLFGMFSRKMSVIPENLLIENKKLKYVLLELEKLMTLPNFLFDNHMGIEYFHIVNSGEISAQAFDFAKECVKLKHLILNSFNLKVLNPQLYKNVKFLETLDLNNNNIIEIPSRVFSPLANLTYLDISVNNINVLNSDSFDGLQNLNLLKLSNNRISELPRGIFTQLANLKSLDLRNNDLTEIHSYCFGVHKEFKTIDFGNNYINSVDEKFIANNNFSFFDFTSNECADFMFSYNHESNLKSKLRRCFLIYQLGSIDQFD